MFLRRILVSFLLFFSWTFAISQTYPVQVSTFIAPPYSPYLSDYTTSATDKISVNLLFNDPVRFELGVKLRVTIEGSGITITTRPDYNPEPLYLQSGIPERLTGTELAPYLDPRNLDFRGLDKRQYERTGALPEGVYRICIEVYEVSRNLRVSNSGCTFAWMILNDPPLINIPFNGEKVRIQEPQMVVFQWTPRHTGSPNSAFSTEYEVELVEIRPKGRNPNDAILTSPPIFTTTTQSTMLIYGPAETPLIPGQQYALRVRARSMSGAEELDLFKNNGYSQVIMFQYGDQCLSPENIEVASASPVKIDATWEAQAGHTSFRVRYRENKPGTQWFEETTVMDNHSIAGLKPDKEYIVQVTGYCGVVGNEDAKSFTVRTPKVMEGDFQCGAPSNTVIVDNTTSRSSLKPGDFIASGDFDIGITSVTGGNGTFSGTGVAYIPWFKLAGFKVVFENIKVNENKQVYAGVVKSIKSADSRWVKEIDTSTPPPLNDGETPPGSDGNNGAGDNGSGGGSGPVLPPPVETLPGQEIITDKPVASDEEGNPVITANDGTRYVVPPGQSTTIVNSDGERQVVEGRPTEGGESAGGGTGTGSPDGGSIPIATGDKLFGPIAVTFEEAPAQIGADQADECRYGGKVTLEFRMKDGDADKLVKAHGVSVEYVENCADGKLLRAEFKWQGDPGQDVGSLGFMSARITDLKLQVDSEGNLQGNVALQAYLNEDKKLSETPGYDRLKTDFDVVVSNGVSGDISFTFESGKEFKGSWNFSGVKNINIALLKGGQELAGLKNASLGAGGAVQGTVALLRPVTYSSGYCDVSLNQLTAQILVPMKNGLQGFSILSGQGKATLSDIRGVNGEVQLNLTYEQDRFLGTISSTSLTAFGMELSDFNLTAEMNLYLDMERLSGTMKAKHPEFNTSIDIQDFEYDAGGLKAFVAYGAVTYGPHELHIQRSAYDPEQKVLSCDVLAKTSLQGNDVSVAVDGFKIDTDGKITMGELRDINASLVLGPVLVSFSGKPSDKGGDRVDGKPTRNISGQATIQLKTIAPDGKEIYKEVSGVTVRYTRLKDTPHTVLSASMQWAGNIPFGEVMAVKAALKGIALQVDKDKNLSGSLQMSANLTEDKQLKDIFILKKGLTGDIAYNFEGSNSFRGGFDFRGLKDINIVIRKVGKDIAALQDAAFDQHGVLTGTFKAMQDASFTSNAFKVTLNELDLSGSYSFNTNSIELHTGAGLMTVSDIRGLNGSLKLALEYGVDQNFNAQLTAGSTDLSAFGFTFKDFSVSVSATPTFDITGMEGTVTAKHSAMDSEIRVSKFAIANGQLQDFNASGNFKYKGFDFKLNKCEYASETLRLTAKIALGVTNPEAQFAVKDFVISREGNISIGEISGDLKQGSYLLVNFNARFQENEFTGSFTGQMKMIGVGVDGTLSIGKRENYQFAYLNLKSKANIPLGPTGLKLTKLGGQIGYNYELTYDEKAKKLNGAPKKGTYLIGLTLGVGDVAGLCEVTGTPIIQLGENSFDLLLNGTLKAPKDNPFISSDLTVHYRLPANTIKGSLLTSFRVPKSTGNIFDANIPVVFSVGGNQWMVHGDNITATLLRKAEFNGSFYYGGQSTPFTVTKVDLRGRAQMEYDVRYSRGIPGTAAKVFVAAHAGFNSGFNVSFDENGFEGEADVYVKGKLSLGLEYKEKTFNGVDIECNLYGKVGYRNNSGYIRGEFNYTVEVGWWDLGTIPVDVDYNFDGTPAVHTPDLPSTPPGDSPPASSGYARLQQLSAPIRSQLDNWPDALQKDLNEDLADQALLASMTDYPTVRAWRSMHTFSTLRKKPSNLSVLQKIAGRFTYNSKTGFEALDDIFNGHESAEKFIANLDYAWGLIAETKVLTLSGIKSSEEARILNASAENIATVNEGKLTVADSRRIWLEKLKLKYGIFDIKNFAPQGLSVSDIPATLYDEMLAEFSNQLTMEDKKKHLSEVIRSGNTVPTPVLYYAGESLYKVVPKDSQLSLTSPFWISREVLSQLERSSNIEQLLGLPLQSHAVAYDIYEIRVKNGTAVKAFQTKIAPTREKNYVTTGGLMQILVLDREKWTDPVAKSSFIPKLQ